MNRAAHQHGVLESFILRHSSPKILTKLPPQLFAAYRFYLWYSMFSGHHTSNQETENANPTTNCQIVKHLTQKSKSAFQIKPTIPNHRLPNHRSPNN
jgi:hypothetical protein